MRLLLLPLLVLAVPAVAGESLQTLSAADYAATVGRFDYAAHTLPLERFAALAAQEGSVVLDLRPREAYDAGHYKGAQWLGPDVAVENLAALAPDKASTLLFYCFNSLQATRMISLTDVALPQAAALGYAHVFKLERIWDGAGHTDPAQAALFEAEKTAP